MQSHVCLAIDRTTYSIDRFLCVTDGVRVAQMALKTVRSKIFVTLSCIAMCDRVSYSRVKCRLESKIHPSELSSLSCIAFYFSVGLPSSEIAVATPVMGMISTCYCIHSDTKRSVRYVEKKAK